MRKHSAFIAIFTLVAIIVASAAAEKLTPKQRTQKARYYYLEAVRLESEERGPESYEMFKRAWQIDSNYVEAASAYGSLLMSVADKNEDEDGVMRGKELLRRFVDKYPAEYNENTYYAWVANQLGDIPEAIRINERLASLYPSRTDILLTLADLYSHQLKKDEVIDAYNRFEAIEGKSLAISSRKATFLLAAGDTAAARREVLDFANADRNGVDSHIFKGLFYQIVNESDSALFNLKAAEKLDSLNGRIKVFLARFYQANGDSAMFDNKTYEALLSEDFDLNDKLGILSEYLATIIADSANVERGDHLFEVLSDQYPHQPEILDLAARFAFTQKNYAKAKEQISYAIDLAPDNEEFYSRLMSFQITEDDYKGAVETYERARKHIDPGESLKMMYSTSCSFLGRYDEAEKTFSEIISEVIPGINVADSLKITPQIRDLDYMQLMKASTFFGMLGDMYYQAKDKEKAFRAYQNAITLMPYNYMTLNNFSYFLAQNNMNLDKAYEMSKQATDAEPDNATFLDTFAYILMKRKEYQQALEYQKKAVELSEKANDVGSELYNHLGDIYFFVGNIDDALENWQKALKLADPKTPKQNEVIQRKLQDRCYYPEVIE